MTEHNLFLSGKGGDPLHGGIVGEAVQASPERFAIDRNQGGIDIFTSVLAKRRFGSAGERRQILMGCGPMANGRKI